MTASVPERRTPAATAEPLAHLRSRGYVRLLVLAAVLGAPISVAAYVLLQLVQQWVFTDLPKGLGFDAEPVGWSVLPLTLTPVVLGYQAWTYHVFRQRVRTEDFQAPPTVPPPRQSPGGGAAQAVPPRPSSPPGGLP